MPHEIITTDCAPKPVGPYSQAVRAGDFLFISGQIPLDPASGSIMGASIAEQTHQALANLKEVLTAAGLTVDSLVKTTVFLRSMTDFAGFNAIYEKELGKAKPARSVVEVSALPRGALLEIEAVACR